MIPEDPLDYKAYENKFDVGDILILKSDRNLHEINADLQYRNPESDYRQISWYLTKEKYIKLLNKKLYVTNVIFWHMGIPFYKLEVLESGEMISLAEFYIQTYGADIEFSLL